MTLASTTPRVQYSGDGATVAFAVTFTFWDATDLRVILTDSGGVETVWSNGTEYTVTGGSGTTGTVTVSTSPTDYTPASGETVTIRSNLAESQTTALPLGGKLPSTAVEQRFDKNVRLIQQVSEKISRSLLLPESSATSDLELPEPSADTVISWNAAGTALENKIINNAAYLSVSAFSLTVVAATTAAAWRTLLGLVIGTDVLAPDGDGSNLTGIPSTKVNLLDNGDFRVVSRGTSFTSATTPANNDDTYLFPRWVNLSDGNDIVDVSQETTTVPDQGYAALKLEVETANKQFGTAQFLKAEDAAAIIGGTATFSFKARMGGSNATVGTLRAAIISWSSTADSVTSDVVGTWAGAGTDPTLAANWTYENTPSDLTLTTSYQTFTISASIDTASTVNVGVFIWCDDTDGTIGDIVYITDIELVPGSSANTTFQHKLIAVEKSNCEYHHRRIVNSTGGVIGIGTLQAYDTANAFGILVNYKTMFAAPTVSYSAVGDFRMSNSAGALADASSATINATKDLAYVGAMTRTGSGLTGGHAVTVYLKDGKYVDFDAEM